MQAVEFYRLHRGTTYAQLGTERSDRSAYEEVHNSHMDLSCTFFRNPRYSPDPPVFILDRPQKQSAWTEQACSSAHQDQRLYTSIHETTNVDIRVE